jgi:hypothetical protein
VSQRSDRGYPIPAAEVSITRPKRPRPDCDCEECVEVRKILYGDPDLKGSPKGIMRGR